MPSRLPYGSNGTHNKINEYVRSNTCTNICQLNLTLTFLEAPGDADKVWWMARAPNNACFSFVFNTVSIFQSPISLMHRHQLHLHSLVNSASESDLSSIDCFALGTCTVCTCHRSRVTLQATTTSFI